jgi:hypothetical protein
MPELIEGSKQRTLGLRPDVGDDLELVKAKADS